MINLGESEVRSTLTEQELAILIKKADRNTTRYRAINEIRYEGHGFFTVCYLTGTNAFNRGKKSVGISRLGRGDEWSTAEGRRLAYIRALESA